MDDRGLFTNFLICKVGVALVAISLAGAVAAMSSSYGRTIGQEKLADIAEALARAIRSVDGMPGEVHLMRKLPISSRAFEVKIIGIRDKGTQIIRVLAIGEGQVERTIMLMNQVNEGEFELGCDSPTTIRLSKREQINLELV